MNKMETLVNLEAAAILMSVEKLHSKFNKKVSTLWGEQNMIIPSVCKKCLYQWEKFSGGSKSQYRPGPEYVELLKSKDVLYPCSELLTARSVASAETLEYVQVYLALERGGK